MDYSFFSLLVQDLDINLKGIQMQIPLRRLDRKLTDTESLSILSKGEYGILSMSTIENGGYGVPLNYVLWNSAIYFHCAIDGAKLKFIKKNNQVSFCVVGGTEILPSKFGTKYESAMIFGVATEVEAQEKQKALIQFVKKYSPEFIEESIPYINHFFKKTRVFKISIEYLSGKSRKT